MKACCGLLLLCFLAPASAATDCEDSSTASAAVVAVCHTEDVMVTLTTLNPNTTHLLIRVERSRRRTNQVLQFQHFVRMEVLLLDEYNGYRNRQFHLDASSLPSSVRKFASRVNLNVTPDAFAGLHDLEDVTLSATSMTWGDFPQIVNQSLCGKPSLKRLSLHKFSKEYGNSPHQVYFDLNVLFAGCVMHSVQELDLSGNDIFVMSSGFSKHFPNLRVLDLSRNQLTKSGFISKDTELASIVFELLFSIQLHTLHFESQSQLFEDWTMFNKSDLLEPHHIPQPSIKCNISSNKYWLTRFALANSTERYQCAGHLCMTLEVLQLSALRSSINLPNYFHRLITRDTSHP